MEHVPANIVHPGVKMFRTQPVADGPAGPDRTCCPVGANGMYAVHDIRMGPIDPTCTRNYVFAYNWASRIDREKILLSDEVISWF